MSWFLTEVKQASFTHGMHLEKVKSNPVIIP